MLTGSSSVSQPGKVPGLSSHWGYKGITLFAIIIIGLAVASLIHYGLNKNYASGIFITSAVVTALALIVAGFSIYRLLAPSNRAPKPEKPQMSNLKDGEDRGGGNIVRMSYTRDLSREFFIRIPSWKRMTPQDNKILLLKDIPYFKGLTRDERQILGTQLQLPYGSHHNTLGKCLLNARDCFLYTREEEIASIFRRIVFRASNGELCEMALHDGGESRGSGKSPEEDRELRPPPSFLVPDRWDTSQRVWETPPQKSTEDTHSSQKVSLETQDSEVSPWDHDNKVSLWDTLHSSQ